MKKIYQLTLAAAVAVAGFAFAKADSVVMENDLSNISFSADGWNKVDAGATMSGVYNTFLANYNSAGHTTAGRVWFQSKGNTQNDWLVSPDVSDNTEAGKTYEASFWISTNKGFDDYDEDYNDITYPASFDLSLHYTSEYPTASGNSTYTPAASTAIATINAFKSVNTWVQIKGTFTATEGPAYVALHVGGACFGQLYVSDFAITEIGGTVEPDPIDPDPIEPGDHVCKGIQPSDLPNFVTGTSINTAAWTVVNVDPSSKTWLYESQSGVPGVKVNYDGSYPKDDWMISPAIHMEAGESYLVKFGMMTYSDPENLDVYVASANTPEALAAGTKIVDENSVKYQNTPKEISGGFSPAVTGDYYIGFHAYSLQNKWWIHLSNPEVIHVVFEPAPVSDLKAVIGENDAIEVNLTWTLPTTDTYGGAIPEAKAFEKVEIFRDEDERAIAELTDQASATSFTDNADYGLTAGKHTYKVVATYAGAASEPAVVKTAWVGPYDDSNHECIGKTVPYTSAIGSKADGIYTTDWTVIDVIGDGGESIWKGVDYDKSSSPIAGAKVRYHSSNDLDDWLISPAIHLERGKDYILMFKVATYSMDESLTLYMADEQEIDALKAGEVLYDNEALKTGASVVSVNVPVTAAVPGDYYFGFWAHTPKNHWWINVGEFKLVENVFTPGPVTGLTAAAGEDRALEVTLNWTLPTVDVFGMNIPEAKAFEKVEIFRDEDERAIAEITDIEEATSFTDNADYGLTSGIHTYAVKVTYAGATSEAATVVTSYVGPFEPMSLPLDVTLVEDTKDAWKVTYGENHNERGKWTANLGTYPKWQYSSNSYSIHDATLFSPEFKVEVPGFYKLTFVNSSGVSDPDGLTHALLCKGQTLEGAKELNINFHKFMQSNPEQYRMVYIEEPGVYSLATRVYSPEEYSGAFSTSLEGVKAEAGKMIPENVSGLQAVANPDESVLDLTVSWTNPTTSTAGTDIAPADYYVKLYSTDNKYANPELIAELRNGETSYTVEVESAGVYYFMVETLATADDATFETPSTCVSSWVGPREVALPYSISFSETNDPTRWIWTSVDGDNDGLGFEFNSNNYFENRQVENDLTDQDMPGYYRNKDYALSPILNLAPGYYEVRLGAVGRTNSHTPEGATSSNYNFYYNIGFVEADTFRPEEPALISKKLITNAGTGINYTNPDPILAITEGGKYQLVVANDEINYKIMESSYSNYQFALSFVKVSKVALLPAAATDLVVEGDPDGALSATFSWTNPTESNVEGVVPVLVKAIVRRDGEDIAEITEGLVPGEVYTYVDTEVPSSGSHIYAVVLFTEDGQQSESVPSVKGWVGGGLEAPYEVKASDGTYSNPIFGQHGWEDYSPLKNGTGWSANDFFDIESTTAMLYKPKAAGEVMGAVISPRLEFHAGDIYKITISGYKANQATSELSEGYPVHFRMDVAGKQPDEWEELGKVYLTGLTYNSQSEHEFFMCAAAAPAAALALLADEAEGDEPAGDDEPVLDGLTQATAVPVTAGTRRVALYVDQAAQNSGYIGIHSFKFEKVGETTGIDGIEVVDGVIVSRRGLAFEGIATDVCVYDLSGKLVKFQAEAEGSVSLENMSQGIYIVRMNLNGAAAALKVVR